MTQQEGNNIVTKTVRGILIVLIPALLLGWGGTYVTVRMALVKHEQAIKSNDEDITKLERKDDRIWDYLLNNTVTRGENVDEGN